MWPQALLTWLHHLSVTLDDIKGGRHRIKATVMITDLEWEILEISSTIQIGQLQHSRVTRFAALEDRNVGLTGDRRQVTGVTVSVNFCREIGLFLTLLKLKAYI